MRGPRRTASLAGATLLVLAAACSGAGGASPSTVAPTPSTVASTSRATVASTAPAAGVTSDAEVPSDSPSIDDLPALDDVVVPDATPATRAEELLLALGDGGPPTVQQAVDAFSITYAPLPGATPSEMPSGGGMGDALVAGLVDEVLDRLTPEQRAIVDTFRLPTALAVEDAAEPGPAPTTVAGVRAPRAASGTADPDDLTAYAKSVLGTLESVRDDVVARHPGIPVIVVGVNASPVEPIDPAVDMSTWGSDDLPGVCVVTVYPHVRTALDDQSLRSALAHEYFHCVQTFWRGAYTNGGDLPGWLLEGSAAWAAFDTYRDEFAVPARFEYRTWYTSPAVGLGARAYGAWPLFEEARQEGVDAYDAIHAMVVDGVPAGQQGAYPSSPPAPVAAPPAADDDPAAVRAWELLLAGDLAGWQWRQAWVSRSVRSTRYDPAAWSMAWPSPGGAGGPVDNVTAGAPHGRGHYQLVGAHHLAQSALEVPLAADVDVVLLTAEHGSLATWADGRTYVVPEGSLIRLCARPEACACPAGSATDLAQLDGGPLIASFGALLTHPTADVVAGPFDPARDCDDDVRRATSNGDPHLRTFDGYSYDAMRPGEYVLARDPAGGFEVQVRNEPLAPGASGTTAFAVASDDHELAVTVGGFGSIADATVDLDGEAVRRPGGAGPVVAASDVALTVVADDEWVVTWHDGSVMRARWNHGWFVEILPSAERGARLVGLLGSADDDPTDDLALPDGSGVDPAGPGQLDTTLVPAWQVDERSTLFVDAPGGPAAPAGEPAGGVAALEHGALGTCRDALGPRATPTEVEACALDLSVTDDAAMVDAHARSVTSRLAADGDPYGHPTPDDAGGGPATAGPASGTDATGNSMVLEGTLASTGGDVDGTTVLDELTGEVRLAAGTVVVAIAASCPVDAEIVLHLVADDAPLGQGATTSRVCDPFGARAALAGADDEVVDGESYVYVPTGGRYLVRVTSGSGEPAFVHVELYADDTPTVVDARTPLADAVDVTLAGIADTLVLEVDSRTTGVVYPVSGAARACAVAVYGATELGAGPPVAVDVCAHPAELVFTPTSGLVIPTVVFSHAPGPVDVAVGPAA